jgi:hypothetical protein
MPHEGADFEQARILSTARPQLLAPQGHSFTTPTPMIFDLDHFFFQTIPSSQGKSVAQRGASNVSSDPKKSLLICDAFALHIMANEHTKMCN